MRFRKFGFDRSLSIISIFIGIICLIEAKRLFPLKSSFLSGDHALPGLAGIAMICLGLLLLFVVKPKKIHVTFPEKSVMIHLMAILGILLIYTISINYVGYVVSTALFGIPLFKLFGRYGWFKCIAISLLCTAGIYLVFILGLGVSFPKGLFL